jgi:lysyl-tRNA synthetase class I
MAALGYNPDSLHVLLYQLVSLSRGGVPVSMSKRSGDFITLEEVIKEVGRDACRFFFAMRGPNTAFDFDLELAKKQSADNPVFYLQYAHARICSIFRQAGGAEGSTDLSLLKEKEERIKAETEARYAKAERDRLKKQLYALTEAQTQAQKDKEAESARRALEEAKRNEAAQAAPTATSANSRGALTKYTAQLADYNAKVSQGATLVERKKMLEKIFAEFDGSGVDLSTINRELKTLKQDESRAKKDYELSMGFYQRLSQQGSSVEERRGMLERIIQKYKGTGIDVGSAEEELKNLK